jgi:hypothetical protein
MNDRSVKGTGSENNLFDVMQDDRGPEACNKTAPAGNPQ